MGISPSNKIIETVTPSSSQIGPFDVYQDDVESTYSIMSTLPKRTMVYERLTFKDVKTGNERTITSSSHYISSNSHLTFPYTIPTSEFMGRLGMRITISAFNALDNTAYQSFGLIVYPIGKNMINPLNYLTNGYSTKNTAVSFPNKTYNEKLIFTNYSDYFLTDIYYRLPFEQFDIKVVSNYKNIPVKTAQMTLKNADDLFANLSGFNGDIRINLKIEEIDGIFRLSLKNPLYVNPSTLVMSYIPIAGYVATNNFYFPVNQMEEMQGLEIAFTITEFGNNKTNLSWTSTYYPTSSVIGACNNSEYCVVGGISQ